ncbi:hypothetical protein [Streptomyces sp. NPDC001380]|uniref:hypothetical protein n=1 Tax=Streptomyces sp. NPDC001380 TaxID=3364566 RepID=UPI00368D58B7
MSDGDMVSGNTGTAPSDTGAAGAAVLARSVSVPEAAGIVREIEDEDLARLPGPRRHLDLLEADLRSGRSCVWYFPDPAVESGRADFFVRELTHRLEAVVPVPGVVSLADRDAGPASAEAQRTWIPGPRGPLAGTDVDWNADAPDDPYSKLLRGLAAPVGTTLPDAVATTVPASTLTLEERLAKELGISRDPVGSLVDQAAVGHAPPTIVVRCWNETSPEEAARLLRVAQATFHEAGLPDRARPRLLFAARAADLPRAVLGDRSRSSIHWWWKVWTRLDTEVLMVWRSHPGTEDAASALLRRVTDAVVAEVCGPDIDRVLTLRDAWGGGDLDSLRAALAKLLSRENPAEGESVPSGRMSTAHAWAPDAEIHDAWARGSVDSWDGHIRPTQAHRLLDSGSHELRVLVCHAQNRVLLPLLEEARTSLIRLVPSLLRTEHFTLRDFCEKARSLHRGNRTAGGDNVPDLHELEIGGLSSATYMLNLTTAQRHRLRALHAARNTLSHRTPLEHDDLVVLAKVLTTDWTVG